MSELWNTGLKAAGADVSIVLSDDLAVLPGALDALFTEFFEATDKHGLVVLNHSWGHFAITRSVIRSVGWFDQRLLGFGEEDGDYAQRYAKHFGKSPKPLQSPGLYNISSNTGFEEVTKGTGKYSLFNRTFFRLKYGMTGESGFEDDLSLSELVGEAHRDPNWDFKQANSHLLDEKNEEVIRAQLDRYFNHEGKVEL
jgi:glycosyltransferase involved in cell wall biosynthesis